MTNIVESIRQLWEWILGDKPLNLLKTNKKDIKELHPDFYHEIHNVAKKIKLEIHRKEYNSVTRFADENDISRSLVSDIVYLRNSPSLVSLLKIAKALDIHVSELLL